MKKVIIYIVFIIFGLFLTYFPLSNAQINRQEPKHTIRQNIKVSQKIEIKNKKNRPQEYVITAGTTALELLRKEDSIQTKGQGETAYITAIRGVEARIKDNEYWAFYVNGKPAEVGAGSYELKMGDTIEWKLEKF